MPSILIDMADASARVGISESNLRRLVKQGKGPRETRIGGRVFINVEHLEQWVRDCAAPVPETAA